VSLYTTQNFLTLRHTDVIQRVDVMEYSNGDRADVPMHYVGLTAGALLAQLPISAVLRYDVLRWGATGAAITREPFNFLRERK